MMIYLVFCWLTSQTQQTLLSERISGHLSTPLSQIRGAYDLQIHKKNPPGKKLVQLIIIQLIMFVAHFSLYAKLWEFLFVRNYMIQF